MLLIFNSLSGKKERFSPSVAEHVTLYVCGITPYDTTHLGHAFTYISFDVLVRYLNFKGYNVSYTQNVTDINDRDKDILERARQQNISWQKLADFWTEKFLKDMKILNWAVPTTYIKASESIDTIVDLIQKLISKNLAYIKNGSVYLDISKFPNYGKLSGFARKQMLSKGADFDEDLDNPDKMNKLDITLWRATDPNQPSHIPYFSSPFGLGRPGWHIECSAMAVSTLGAQIDIHGGGADLKFPHHEAEIAQSEGATGKAPFAKFWMHTGEVSYRGEKMSKSKGNLVMVSDLLKNYSANTIRFMLLSHHYSEAWEFYEKDMIEADNKLKKISLDFKKNKKDENSDLLWKKFNQYLEDDLDVPGVLKFIVDVSQKGSGGFVKGALEILGFVFKN